MLNTNPKKDLLWGLWVNPKIRNYDCNLQLGSPSPLPEPREDPKSRSLKGGLGFRGLGFRGLGLRGLGFRVPIKYPLVARVPN